MDVYASYANQQQRSGTGQGTSQATIPSVYQSSLPQPNPLAHQLPPHPQHQQQQQHHQQQQQQHHHQQQQHQHQHPLHQQPSQPPQPLYAQHQSSPMLSTQQPLSYGPGASPASFDSNTILSHQQHSLLTSPANTAYPVPPVQGGQFSLSSSKVAALATAAAVGPQYPAMPPPMDPSGGAGGQHIRQMNDRGLHSSPQMPSATMGHSPMRQNRRPSQQPQQQLPMGHHVGGDPSGQGLVPDRRNQALLGSASLTLEDEPLYVNAKQFHRILKRRVTRAMLDEAFRQKGKKPKAAYLHESRHQHAMRRPRGPGGRFLTADEAAALKRTDPSNLEDGKASSLNSGDNLGTNGPDEKEADSLDAGGEAGSTGAEAEPSSEGIDSSAPIPPLNGWPGEQDS